MTPKFSVGEVVILQSVSHPEWNGEYTVAALALPGISTPDPHYKTNICISMRCGIGYILDDASLTDFAMFRVRSASFDESALRKKHQPGELSYTDLLESLNSPIGAPA